MRRSLACALFLSLLATSSALAGIRPLLPGEQIVYQTVQTGANYRSFPNFVSQITGNAYTEYGDEVKLDGTNKYITNIAVGTQTFFNNATPAYMDGVNQSGGADPVDVGGFLELSIYINDGPSDPSNNSLVDSPPHGQLQPGTLIGRSRVPTPIYPQGGVSSTSNGLNANANAADNALDPWIVEFPFPFVEVPTNRIITFALINLNRNGLPDGNNSDGNQFGVWHALGTVGALAEPVSGGPYFYGTNYNTNAVGTSRTGPNVNRFNDNGMYTWKEYNAQWESDRATNNVIEATIYAALVPEPSSLVLGACGFVGFAVACARRRSRRIVG